MIYELPFTTDGCAVVTVPFETYEYTFKTYFVRGQRDAWLLDISEPDGTVIAAGVKLVPGSKSVVHGLGEAFVNVDLFVVLTINKSSVEDQLGGTLEVYWLSDAEQDSVFELPDVLEEVGYAFGE